MKRAFVAGALALAALAPAWAQDCGTRPLHLIVGYSAGGAVDILARALGEQLAGTLARAVVVDDKPGAATNIAVKDLIASKPDGCTLMLAANALAANQSLFSPPPFDSARDVVPVALVGRVPVVVATRAGSPYATLAALVAAARAKPGTITYSTPGNGSTPHLAFALFAHEAGITLVHVPYKGGAPAIADTVGGQVDLVAVNALEALPLARGGRLHVLAAMSARRTPVLPQVPTVAESGWPGFEASVWYGLIAPAATPPAIVHALNAAVQKALAAPAVRERLAQAGGEVDPGTPAAFGALVQAERQRYAKLIAEAGIKVD